MLALHLNLFLISSIFCYLTCSSYGDCGARVPHHGRNHGGGVFLHRLCPTFIDSILHTGMAPAADGHFVSTVHIFPLLAVSFFSLQSMLSITCYQRLFEKEMFVYVGPFVSMTCFQLHAVDLIDEKCNNLRFIYMYIADVIQTRKLFNLV